MNLSAMDIAKDLLLKIKQQPLLAEQFELNRRIADGGISLEEALSAQRGIEDKLPQGKEYSWELLKVRNPALYEHEIKHYEVRKKYGFNPKLYHEGTGYYVLDDDFEQVSRDMKYTLEDLKRINMEAHIAPHKDKEYLTSDRSLDVFSYEVLNGKIKKMDENEIEKAMKKYKWIASSGWLKRYKENSS